MALVTGASRRIGIGAAVCRELAAGGARVAFTTWSPYDAEMDYGADDAMPGALLDDLQALSDGVPAVVITADLSQPDAAPALFDHIEHELGPVTLLVNNAAHSTREDWRTLNAAAIDAHYAVNVRGTALLSVEFARRFVARAEEAEDEGRINGRRGAIVNLTSGQTLRPMAGELSYAMSKGAVEALTTSLADGLMEHGITVNAVNPGPTDTGWMGDFFRDELAVRTAAGRVGSPEDAARLIAWLLSDDGRWVTGQVLHSEGGFRG